MKLEEFMEQYLLRNPEPSDNQVSEAEGLFNERTLYKIKLEDIMGLFQELQGQGYTDNLTIDEARLIVLSHERGFQTAWDYAGAYGVNRGIRTTLDALQTPSPR